MDTLRSALNRLEEQGAALGHFNVSDLVLLKAVIAAADEIKVPVLVGASEGERAFFGTRQLAVLVKSLREEFGLAIFLNADHTHSLAKAIGAVKAGFDAVIADFSALPFAENVARTRETVEALKSINPSVLVEGEIGNIGSGSEVHDAAPNEFRNLTTPEEAGQFVAATGIDAPDVLHSFPKLPGTCEHDVPAIPAHRRLKSVAILLHRRDRCLTARLRVEEEQSQFLTENHLPIRSPRKVADGSTRGKLLDRAARKTRNRSHIDIVVVLPENGG